MPFKSPPAPQIRCRRRPQTQAALNTSILFNADKNLAAYYQSTLLGFAYQLKTEFINQPPPPSTVQPFWGLAYTLKQFHGDSNEVPNDPQPTKKPPILRNEAMSG